MTQNPQPSLPARIWRSGRGAWQITSDRNFDLIAAGVAFYTLLAIFPAVAAAIAVWGVFLDPALINGQLAELRTLVPPQAFAVLEAQITALTLANNSTLGWASAVSLAAALWSARLGTSAMMRGLNAAHDAPSRSGLRRVVAALVITASLIGVALVALASLVATPVILAFVPLGEFQGPVLSLLRWALTVGVMVTGIGIVLRFAPNLRGRRPPLWSAGAFVAFAIWAVASTGLAIYLKNFANYNEVYGSIGAVIALLMWFFLSAYAVLIGGAVNGALMRRRRR